MVTSGTLVTEPISRQGNVFFGGPRAKMAALSLLLIASTIAIYLPVHRYPFVNYDDPWYVRDNPYIQEGLTPSMLYWSFTERGYCHNWHPLTWVSHGLDIQMFGLDAGPHHDVNVLLHVLDVLLLFWVLYAATGYMGRSFMVAALFAVHPINVESVAWLSERKTVLSMVFFLLTFAAYRWYARKPSDGRYALVGLLYVMGLMAKPQVIALPLLLLLWDYWPLQRLAWKEEASEAPMEGFARSRLTRLVVEKIPLFVIGVGAAVMTMQAQEAGTPQKWWSYSLAIRIENAIVSYGWYIRKAIWPSRLAPFYPHPGNSLTAWQVLSSLAVLLLITALVLLGRRHRYLVVGWFWFLIALLPMIGLIQAWEQGMADRYAYQSFLGLFIIACWGGAELAQRVRIPALVIAGVSVAVLVSLGVAARIQTRYWEDSVAIWKRSLAITPDQNFVANSSLAYVLTQAGRQAEAVPYLVGALQLRPADPVANLELADYDHRRGDLTAALEHYNRVLSAPDSVTAQRRYALTNMARVYTTMGNSEEARQCLEQAQRLPPDDAAHP